MTTERPTSANELQPDKKSFWFKLACRLVMVFTFYVASYAVLTRLSLWMHAKDIGDGYYIVLPVNAVAVAESSVLNFVEFSLRTFYWPLIIIERTTIGSGLSGLPMMRLSG